MQNYKDKYAFRYERDVNGQVYNKDDNFLACRAGGKVYRINEETLRFVSPHKIRIKKVNEEGITEWDYTNLLLEVYDTEVERIITFKESDLEKLEDLFKIRKKYKRILTEEQREELRERLKKMWEAKGRSNEEISEYDLEEELESENDIDENEELYTEGE
ncbi:hypothetical protein [Clostridium sp.]|uniref:hypothetical protein n=1 Tax=Clostridium sp. TaxID=1506 RepID=UPI0026287555|nr:hypothetical protein [Clostridium sp.]